MKELYQHKTFQEKTMEIIAQADGIISEYRDQGFNLTLRQLYYQFVARGLLPNRQSSYNRLGRTLSEARLAGLIDWDAIVDRTRALNGFSTWESPEDILEAARQSYREDKWEFQPKYIEVWVEKEALAGVVQQACAEYEVPSFSCRGYVSQSEMWAAAKRMARRIADDKQPVILHLGDHDPSGIDMTRDIMDRLWTFGVGMHTEVKRIALNWDQIEQYNPPPNPAKVSDSRFEEYRRMYGEDSWELDAMEPGQLSELIQETVSLHMDKNEWDKAWERQEHNRYRLECMKNNKE